MRAHGESTHVAIHLSVDEAKRLAVLLYEATCVGSRAEFWIRTGCSAPNVVAIRDCLWALASGETAAFDLELIAGEEETENPRRPRAGGDC